MKEKRNVKKEKKRVASLLKRVRFVIGLSVKGLKERKVAGLTVMPQMVKVAINLVVVHPVKNEKNTLHVDQLLVHAKKEAVVSLGAKKVQKSVAVKKGMNRWKCQIMKLEKLF